ncbi:FAD-binding 9 siderophore-interacting domain-containing protein [Microbacterium testaceum]|uniref:FAD-binding 9 siderophore-interacting domain-containing protein n=1 Tax=Microbacterium testaceum TaxID=2033 RepID=A0A147EXH9_MICTE|nr:siderophore-interacting protein [Microbacterium testaceum]KTR94684.1 FAD-binding 9 siderophore-interacting domain-containing protein [Microbacterium testaceum]
MSNSTLGARLEPRRHELVFRSASLAARTFLTPSYVRLRLEGSELRSFDSAGTDDHIRVFFSSAPTVDLRSAPSREYTPVSWDAERGWLDIDVALHGDGVGSRWAETAPLGAPVGVGGPRGSMVLVGRPDAWLLAGDETAVPAIRRFAAAMDDDAVGRIAIEVPDAAHDLPVAAPAGVQVIQVHRGDRPAGAELADWLDALDVEEQPEGCVFGFVAAEQSIVRAGRALLVDRWSGDPAATVVKGYWKRGTAEYHAPH